MPKHTKDVLADALREAGLLEMADIAATGYYHDFLSPLTFPTVTLVKHLGAEAEKTGNGVKRHKIEQLIYQVEQGFFDASEEEAAEWAASPDGLAAMKDIAHG